jgi:selenide,water dikinase
MEEAGVILVGGHSVEDDELKYGLSVTGVIHPGRVLLNRGARAGDRLILTKPLGTGIVSTAVKGGVAGDDLIAGAVACMTTLNREAAELVVQTPGVHACTDITGFGLLGHACEMIENSDVSIKIRTSAVPFFPGIRELVEGGIVPAGLYRNRDFRAGMVEAAAGCPAWLVDILFDPQTAGGLFVALAPEQADGLVRKMRTRGLMDAAVVGEVLAEPKGCILLV